MQLDFSIRNNRFGDTLVVGPEVKNLERTKRQQSKADRYESYRNWIGNEPKKNEVAGWLEKAGVPLELRATGVLEKNGYRCSEYYFRDSEEPKFRELDIYAFKNSVKSIKIGECEAVFNVVILAECKYSHNLDFLAFESDDTYFPAFPVIFSGTRMLGASYHDFDFPMIIRKIAETDIFNLKWKDNFQDRKTHESCEELISCFSYLYERKQKRIAVNYDQYRLLFGRAWVDFVSKDYRVGQKVPRQKISEFLKEKFSPMELLAEIKYFPIEIGFPLIIINEDRGLIKIEYDEKSGEVKDFDDVGYGIYPFVSENADKYGNVLHEYFSFPVIVCNLSYLEKCLETLNNGMEKMAMYAKTLLQNNPYAIAEEVLERIFAENIE